MLMFAMTVFVGCVCVHVYHIQDIFGTVYVLVQAKTSSFKFTKVLLCWQCISVEIVNFYSINAFLNFNDKRGVLAYDGTVSNSY